MEANFNNTADQAPEVGLKNDLNNGVGCEKRSITKSKNIISNRATNNT